MVRHMTDTTAAAGPAVDPDALKMFSFQLFTKLEGAVTAGMIHLGDQLGLYTQLKDAGAALTTAELAERAGLDADKLADTERGSVSGITRRVSEFDFDQVRENAFLNGATDLALTFADYLDPLNGEARSFEELTAETREFIAEVEDRIGLPVSLVSVGFFPGCIIDRRTPS
jgi:hypothetical protein